MKKNVLLIACLLLVSFFAQGQQQGNIVEYFGRERVDRIDEGKVLHWFGNGYMLQVTARSGYLFNMVDGLAWEIATGKFNAPKEGKLDAVNYGSADTEISWIPTMVDSTGKFTHRDLRRSYLYTEYKSNNDQVVLLETSGNTRTFINGLPHEGDHYDFAYTLIPFRLKKGNNEFLFTFGRFGRVEAKLITPTKSIMFTQRDMTLPDIINGEANDKWGAIRVVNAQDKALTGLTIKCTLSTGESVTYNSDDVMPMMVRKIKFLVPAVKSTETGRVTATLALMQGNKELDRTEITLQQRNASGTHERTFISKVDGSVQYYSITPSSTKGDNQALFLSVHGAGVEARNQARAYKPKDWGHVVAATNRRPYGFNWEDWGRMDALEVLEDSRALLKTAPEKTYLTGHSMGGHGTWVIGVNYPDKFAAIAPCASYPDIAGYGGGSGNADAENRTFTQFIPFERAANAGRSLQLKQNYLQQGVYIFHGSEDRTVPTAQARMMRQLLSEYHDNFCYYEYPGGSHWFGDESVDWKPIFEFFKRHTLATNDKKERLDFTTASPGVSEKDYWITILQQDTVLGFSNAAFEISQGGPDFSRGNFGGGRPQGEFSGPMRQPREKGIIGTTRNVVALALDIPSLKLPEAETNIIIDGKKIPVPTSKAVTLKKVDNEWQITGDIPVTEKYPARYAGFKFAFTNNVVFVYATGGTPVENEWYMNKARFDSETFLYRGNGSIEVIADKDFNPDTYADRNVVIYGNASNNKAWAKLLTNSPVQVKQGEITVGSKSFKGSNYGIYFIYPRTDSKTASIGVVAGTGIEGMKGTFPNDYFFGFNGFPDLAVFTVDMLRNGIKGVKMSGFFGNDWSVEKGNFITE